MAIYDNKRLVVKICKLFYKDNMSQKDISLALGISKPQVCRMLNFAKENHIVEFTINNPYSQEFQLEEKLIEKYSLKEAFVFNFSYQNQDEAINKLGECCAEQLDKYFTDNSIIGVMSGRTIAAISNFAHKLTREGLNFVPLVGNIGSQGHKWHANVIAENFAHRTGGNYSLLNAPIILQNPETCNLIKKEPSISQILVKGRACNIALIGIGEINLSSTSYLCGAFSEDDITKLTAQNAVASVCTSYVSKDGKILDTELNLRSIGISLDELTKSITIAFSTGKEKIEATKAVLKSGYIDIFMTSQDMAEELLEAK
ncbi:sugar-binding transcriptional regulator [Clostridium magnum]|uniref:Sorbitol operon regulator n=1 Tax=Clostridium magnum DSM 2767 TaxID=1121326 RepID=A0A161X556_9CLOT|nr:sugar-binding transcriptional regulator [Clostridium magnum]KZL89096.1 sorbitol operon regulator [Clostridium magnum DSM 2767]SHI29271.1 DNA-binding transcriptional regulator LsrR, DeoR family [Clostridium magnum DSM 2767]